MNKNTMNSIDSHGHGNNGETTKNAGTVPNKPKYRSGKHEVNLQKRGFVRFQIGLILAMTLVYFALEATFANMQTASTEHTIPESEVIEYHADAYNYTIELPKEKRVKKLPKVSHTFEIVTDDTPMDLGKEFISEPVDEPSDIPLDEITYVEAPEVIKVPYAAVEVKPIFPGCEKMDKTAQEACFQKKMTRHVQRIFRYPEMDETLGREGKVHVFFDIDKKGNITNITMRGPSKSMENEANRIVGKLPRMTPGKQQDKTVKVSFYLPINFKLRQ